jgi:hypothetical protein
MTVSSVKLDRKTRVFLPGAGVKNPSGAPTYHRREAKMANVFAALALVSVAVGVIFSMMVVGEVSRRGVKINYFLLRILLFKYISQYKQLTTKETGRIGPLYYPCVVSYQLALIFAVVFILVR